MATVYIIYSKTIDKFYIGSCLDIETRLKQHNDAYFKNCFTSKSNDWYVFFSINDLNYEIARKIEAHIKSMKSRKYISNLNKYPEISQKLLRKYVGSSR